MKISICGKGGSGKSTVVTLLTFAFKRGGRRVIVLDSDESNASLFWMLGFDRPPQPLMDFLGGKKIIQQKMIARFSKGESEPTMSIWEMNTITSHSIPLDYVAEKDGIALVSTGKIHQALEGCACPMGAVSREFLKKFQTHEDEILLVDMEAGIEHFGRGLETGVDGVISVVEPSMDSISLAKRVMELTRSTGASFYGAVLNKISSRGQRDLLEKRLSSEGIPILGSIGFYETIQTSCLEGKRLVEEKVPFEITEIANKLLRLSEMQSKEV